MLEGALGCIVTSDRESAEDERAPRLAQEEAGRTKDERVSVAGHELRPPLASLVGGELEPVVLVVDDDARLQFFLSETVRQAGYATIAAGGPAEAMAVLERNPAVAFVLTDVRMPAPADGVEFIRTVRRRWPNLPLAAVAGDPADLADLRGSPEFPRLILPKPVRGRQIRDALRLTLEQSASPLTTRDGAAVPDIGLR